MKKILSVLLALVVLAGCASTPMSSVYNGAKPSHVIANGDGSTTFEFMFHYDNDWDGNMAMQRINEYLTSYASQNGFSGYDTINVDGKVIEKTNTGSAIAAGFANFGAGYSHSDSPPVEPKKDEFVRALVQVRFKT